MYTTLFFVFPALLDPDGCALTNVELVLLLSNTGPKHSGQCMTNIQERLVVKSGSKQGVYSLNLSLISAAARLSHFGLSVPVDWFFELHQDHGHVITPLSSDC
jgi:hypothetical protein